eukprot:33239-Eustigmatos_ZCMA.PRE.1
MYNFHKPLYADNGHTRQHTNDMLDSRTGTTHDDMLDSSHKHAWALISVRFRYVSVPRHERLAQEQHALAQYA